MYDFFKPFHDFPKHNFLYDQKKYHSYEEILILIQQRILRFQNNKQLINTSIIPIKTENHFDFIIDLFALWKLGKVPMPIPSNFGAEALKNSEDIKLNKNAALVIMTTGSQGYPKLIVHSFESLYYSALGSTEFYQMKAKQIFPLTLSPLHIGGLMIILRAYLIGGVINLGNGSWKDLLINDYDFVSLVPKQLKDILHSDILLKTAKQAKALILGGAKLHINDFKQALNQELAISLSYGQTETCAQVMATKPGSEKYELGEVLPFRKIRIVEDQKFLISGPCLFIGEISQGEYKPFTKKSYSPQDKAILDTKHNIIGVERLDDIINSGGKKISPSEIRQYTFDHFTVNDIEVFKLFDTTWGEIPLVAIELGKQTNTEDINYKLLEKYKRPKFIKSYSEFPITGIKTDRQRLKRNLVLNYLKTISPFDFSYQEYIQNKNSPLLVYLHGFMGNKADQFFDQTGYDVLCFNMPGHGKTKSELFIDFNDISEQLLAIFTLLSTEDVVFYGYSMGGRLLASTVKPLLQLNKNNKFYFESTHLGLNNNAEMETRLIQDQKIAQDLEKIPSMKKYNEFLDAWYDLALFNGIKSYDHYQDYITERCVSNDINSIKEFSKGLLLMSLGHQKNVQTLIEQKNCFFLIGALDEKFKNYYQEIFNPKANQENIKLIDRASHNVHFSHPQEVINFVKITS